MSPKRSVRQAALARRDALPAIERAAASRTIAKRVTDLDEWARARTVAAYAPIGSEVDARVLASRALDEGKRLALPRTDPARRSLSFHVVTSLDALEPGAFRVPEPRADAPLVTPDDVDLALVPGVAFDVTGHRLGYGHGYFDRFLHRVTGFKIGLAFEVQVHETLPTASHDVPVDALVTDARVRSFAGAT